MRVLGVILGFLFFAGAAPAQTEGDSLPEWLVGTWKFVGAYLPDNLTPEDKEGEVRGERVNLGYKIRLKLSSKEIDYRDSAIFSGGARMLLVKNEDKPLSELTGAEEARNPQNGKLDLAKLKVSLMVKPQSCYSESDRSDEFAYKHYCVGYLVARLPGQDRILLYLFQEEPDHIVSKSLWEFQRQKP